MKMWTRGTGIFRVALAGACALLSACQIAGTDTEIVSVEGTWGGEHILMEIRELESVLEYDCARGTIDEPIEPDGEGFFHAFGVHVFEHGGPIRDGEQPDTHPARYHGSIRGSSMILTIFLMDIDTVLGPFELEHGRFGRVFRCL